jgi:hypothetical protein
MCARKNKNTDSILNSNFLLSYNISRTHKDKKKKLKKKLKWGIW